MCACVFERNFKGQPIFIFKENLIIQSWFLGELTCGPILQPGNGLSFRETLSFLSTATTPSLCQCHASACVCTVTPSILKCRARKDLIKFKNLSVFASLLLHFTSCISHPLFAFIAKLCIFVMNTYCLY